MPHDLRARLARLSRWPRRVAAAVCLILAAFSALAGRRPPSGAARPAPPAPARLADRLAPGQVALPVRIDEPALRALLRPGDRIDLYAAPTDGFGDGTGGSRAPVGTDLRVLAVERADNSVDASAGTALIVAADRTAAARIAGLAGARLVAVLDRPP